MPSLLLALPLVVAVPGTGLAVGSVKPKPRGHLDEEPLLAMPAPSADRIWVQVRQPVSLRDLSRDLQLKSSTLAKLNNVDIQHRFDRGDWVVLPSTQGRVAKQLAVLDASQMRRTPPPMMAPPPVQTTGVVRLGETLPQVAQRYGTTMQELLRLNPGIKTTGLMVGTEVQLVESSPMRQQPVGGLPPEPGGLPPAPPRRFDQAMDELVREGIISPEERQRIRAGLTASPLAAPAYQRACSTGVLPAQECRSGVVVRWRGRGDGSGVPSPFTESGAQTGKSDSSPRSPSRDQSRKTSAEIEAEIYRRRSSSFLAFGACSYEWSLWRVDARGIRTTRFRCGSDDLSNDKWIAVDCKTLKVSRRHPPSFSWSPWSYPSSDNVVSMVAKLCANTVTIRPPDADRDLELALGVPVSPVLLIA